VEDSILHGDMMEHPLRLHGLLSFSRIAESILILSVLIPAPAIDFLTGQSNDSILGYSINQSIHSKMWMHLLLLRVDDTSSRDDAFLPSTGFH